MPSGDESHSTAPVSAKEASAQEHSPEATDSESHGVGLYVLPALIVLIFVGAWLSAFWLLHEGQDPQSLVAGMQQPGRRSWQNAYALSQLLANPDHDVLRDDRQLCDALARVLIQQNLQAEEARRAGAKEDEELARFRAFLCRALGTFRIPNGLPALLDCAAADRWQRPASRSQQHVQLAAIEAIAVLATNVGAQTLQANSMAIEVLVDASRNTGQTGSGASESDIAAAATFALGVIGGSDATKELLHLVTDPRPDVRYNAATGLARQCRSKAIPVLLEMLDPENRTATGNEKTESARARKQWMVLSTAIRATERLLRVDDTPHQQQLLDSLQRLRDSNEVPSRIRIDAKEVLLKLQDR